jgi:hypothetical protein
MGEMAGLARERVAPYLEPLCVLLKVFAGIEKRALAIGNLKLYMRHRVTAFSNRYFNVNSTTTAPRFSSDKRRKLRPAAADVVSKLRFRPEEALFRAASLLLDIPLKKNRMYVRWNEAGKTGSTGGPYVNRRVLSF